MKKLIAGISIVWGLYQLIYSQTIFLGPIEHQAVHFGFALVLTFLFVIEAKPKRWPFAVPFIVLSLAAIGYILFDYTGIEWRHGMPNLLDSIISVVLVVLSLVGVKVRSGWALVVVCLIFMAYAFFGQYLPGMVWHFPIPLKVILANYVTNFSGIFGAYLGLSANLLFLYMLFGGILAVSGAGKCIIEVAKLAGRGISGGTAMMAVTSSALVGTITGAASADIAITGTVTIPLMKRVGYSPEQAAAIEAVAANGAAIVPPVMAAVAFLMAGMLGIPYIKIAAMAIIPSVLYYFSLALYVQFTAKRSGIKSTMEAIDKKAMFSGMAQFLLPLATLTILLIMGRSPAYAAFWSTVVLIPTIPIMKEGRGKGFLKILVKGFSDGAKVGATMAVLLSVVGLIATSITMTGVTEKFPGMITELSHGNLTYALVLVGLMALILGGAVPPIGTYVLIVVLAAPALVKLGLPLVTAHFFVLVCSIFSQITPPVGIACMIAAPIAGARYFSVCWEAMKAAAVAFLLPFLVVSSPIIMLQPQEPLSAIFSLLAAFNIVALLEIAFTGYFIRNLNLLERVMAAAGGLSFFTFLFGHSFVGIGIGFALDAALVLSQLRKRRQEVAASVPIKADLT